MQAKAMLLLVQSPGGEGGGGGLIDEVWDWRCHCPCHLSTLSW